MSVSSQLAAMEALTKVAESMKSKPQGESRKMALPSLKAMNFNEKLTMEVMGDPEDCTRIFAL